VARAPRRWRIGALAALVAAATGCGGASPGASDAAADLADAAGDAALPEPQCVASLVEPVDVIAWARLSASSTRAPLIPPWPREDLDSIATVRDDDPATGWKVPTDGPATITIDLGPRVGRPLALDRLQLDLAGPVDGTLTIRLSLACGGPPSRTLVAPLAAAALELDGACAACVAITVEAPTEATVTGLRLYSRDAALPSSAPEPPPAAATDPGAGVVEGFYGVPWTFAERRKMLHTLAHLGLGTYVYAPKSDPLHRADWRLPYPAAFTDALGALAALGRSLGVDVVFGISPFIDLDTASPADTALLHAKLATLQAAGLRHFALLADDIELDATLQVDGELGQRHVAVTLAALAALRAVDPGATMRFVPTVYSDQRRLDFADGDAYLAALTALPADLPWLWTGPDTGNAQLAPEDLTTATALVGAPPMIWDNLWANDGGDGFFGHIPLGPYAGRAAGLRAATAGILQNPLIQGGLARLVVGTFGASLEGAADADLPARAVAVEALRSPETADTDSLLLRLLMETLDAAQGEDPGHPGFEAALAALADALNPVASTPPAALADALEAALPIFAALSALESTAHHSGLAADLVDELDFPLDKVRAEADRAIAALALLAAQASGVNASEAAAALADAEQRSLESRFIFSTGATDALAALAASSPPPTALSAGPLLAPPDRACVVGQPFAFAPAGQAPVRLAAAGPPGMRVDGATVRFTPRHPGTYDLVVLAWTDAPATFSATRAAILCEARP
jgi:hyaluronoglucosaminidase